MAQKELINFCSVVELLHIALLTEKKRVQRPYCNQYQVLPQLLLCIASLHSLMTFILSSACSQEVYMSGLINQDGLSSLINPLSTENPFPFKQEQLWPTWHQRCKASILFRSTCYNISERIIKATVVVIPVIRLKCVFTIWLPETPSKQFVNVYVIACHAQCCSRNCCKDTFQACTFAIRLYLDAKNLLKNQALASLLYQYCYSFFFFY